jgi:hypothetical protein
MSLPFLKPKAVGSVIIVKAKPEGGTAPESEEGKHAPELLSASEDLIQAIASKDATAVADALAAAFYFCDSEPHVEGPHLEDE